MPIIKSTELQGTGITAEYWVIEELRIVYGKKTARIKYGIYKDKAAFLAGKKPVNRDQELQQVKDRFVVPRGMFSAFLTLLENKTQIQLKNTIDTRLVATEAQFSGAITEANT